MRYIILSLLVIATLFSGCIDDRHFEEGKEYKVIKVEFDSYDSSPSYKYMTIYYINNNSLYNANFRIVKNEDDMGFGSYNVKLIVDNQSYLKIIKVQNRVTAYDILPKDTIYGEIHLAEADIKKAI